VLAFSLANSKPVKVKKKGDRSPPLFVGDVVISVPTARRQARERRHGLRREMAWLMIHGILHLLGYDHEKANDARRMQRKERVLLRQLTDKNR
jgi:rRNA maturation RNase YbeY